MDLDDFSDDGFDDLPADALQELENHAIQFTQAQQIQTRSDHAPQQRLSDYGWDGEEEDEDLDTTEVTNDEGVPVGRPPGSKAPQPQAQSTARTGPPPPNPNWNPMVDPSKREAVSSINATSLASRQRVPINTSHQVYAASQRFQPSQAPTAQLRPSQFARPPLPQTRYNASQSSQALGGQPSGSMVAALQQRVRALEGELNAARGEAAIIRSNATKAQQHHDAEVARLKKLTAEQMARQERILEAAVAAEKTASTELQFLQRDLKEVNDRARRKENATAGAAGSFGNVTPKKSNKTWGFADGFDDMDLVPSPTKGPGRAKGVGSVATNVGERTPTKGKRKRPTVDSPVMALETHTDDDVLMADDVGANASGHAQEHIVVQVAPTPLFDFLPLVLDHGSIPHQPPTFDLLSRFSFTSEPSISFSSIIFQKLPLMGDPRHPMQLLVDFTELICSIWVRCVEDRYWEPIKHLVSLVSFTLQLHTTTVAVWTFRNLAAVAQTTIFMVAEGRHFVPDGDLSKHEKYSGAAEHIDTTYIMSLLHLIAMACSTTPVKTDTGVDFHTADLWRLLTFDFVLLLLTPKQKLTDTIAMLSLLTTSVLPQSIGPLADDKSPSFVASSVIERVSAKLIEVPISARTVQDRHVLQICALRTLISFARHPFGATQLASHSNVLPRLVACLSTSIDALYDCPLPSSILPPPPDDLPPPFPDKSSMLSTIVSQCVLLIHTLVTSPATAEVADLAGKLSLSHGGSQRYILSLGRLTFAEDDLVLESGIEAEVVEAAHELLEMVVTPDEGELVSEAFGA